MIQTLDAMITSTSSSDTAFIRSPFYKAKSTNLYSLNNDRELANQLANQLGVANFGPSGFSSLPAENPLEPVASTSPSIIELDSDTGPSSLSAKCRRSCRSCK